MNARTLDFTPDPASTPTPAMETSSWRQMLEAPTLEVFARHWLALQCGQIEGTISAVLVLGAADTGPYAPVAFWPEGCGTTPNLSLTAELALDEGRGVLREADDAGDDQAARCAVALPIVVDQRRHGVVALELDSRPEALLRVVMRQLQWGLAWVELRVRREARPPGVAGEEGQAAQVLQLLGLCIEPPQFQAAAANFVTQLATRFGCERVSIGFRQGHHVKVRSVSHSAQFSERAQLVECLGEAMDEALDQGATLCHPSPQAQVHRLTRAQARLSASHGGNAICTIPLLQGGRPLGALTLERPADQPLLPNEVTLLEVVALLAGPILDLKRRDDRWLGAKLAEALTQPLQKLVGTEHYGPKTATLLILVAGLGLAFGRGDYRIAADAKIEGEIQRVVAAPIDGYVREAVFRAGDLVQPGTVLARLDDRDLRLEKAKWTSQREQYARQFREALAQTDRAQIAILKAKIAQAEAELALVEEQLARTEIRSPFAGIVVSGDLSQSLGAPVQRGDILFEVAPLDAYRAILNVDEADMKDLRVGQAGQLVLTGESTAVLPIQVSKITPVAEAKEGHNTFRVEARLEQTPPFLRPGMKGIGKVEIGERTWLWIWTHRLGDWLRLALWRFWP